MKICFILDHFYPFVGGNEKLFMDIALGLRNRGYKVRVITSNTGSNVEYRNYKGIQIYYFKWLSLFNHPIPRIKDLLPHTKWADIIHTATMTVPPVSLKAGHISKKPVVITVHEICDNKWYWLEDNKFKAFIFKMVEWFIITRKYDYYHVVSDSTLKDAKKIGINKNIKRVYNPIVENNIQQFNEQVDLYNFFNIDKTKKVFLYYGRPGKPKGIFVYLDAIKHLIRNINKDLLEQCRFCFILSQEPEKERKRFIQAVNTNKLGKYVLVNNSVPREDLNQYIKQADFIVVPSITEGFGFSALEACELGKRLICSTAGSLPEVTYGKCTYFENRNSIDLSNKIRRLLELDDSLEKKIDKKSFSYEETIKGIIEIYRYVLTK